MGSLFEDDDVDYTPQDSVVYMEEHPTTTTTETVNEEIAAPALKQDVEGDAKLNAENAARARQMKAGIGSTYTRFNSAPANASSGNGAKAKLGT